MVKYTPKHMGKWVVVYKDKKILAYGKSFAKLRLKFKDHKDQENLMYAPVPRGPIA